MASVVKFIPMAYSKYEAGETLPAKFKKLLESTDLGARLKDKTVAIKIHVGDGIGYSTIPPVFMRVLSQFVKANGGDCFFTDHYVHDRRPENRGYTETSIGAPIIEGCGYLDKYFYTVDVDFNTFKHVDVAGHIKDADFLIDFSHVKGHGSCGYGGACKNIAMGCVTDRTRHEIHALEGGLVWNKEACIHCDACIESCNHYANKFNKNGDYEINPHHCTTCQHCVKVCPTQAIVLEGQKYRDFQMGMALCTKAVVDTFEPGNVYYINLLTQITALCDCWGMTTPSLVPDIGLMASDDMVALELASVDAIKMEDLIPAGVPQGFEMAGDGHLFERLHGKNPYVQIELLEQVGLGSRDYTIEIVK